MKLAIWPAIAFSLQIAVLVTARHLPYDDDLQADSLVLVNKTRRDISVEGSGDDDVHEIKPMPRGVITMERMEAAPDMEKLEHADHIETLQDEGSGDLEAENPKTEPVIAQIDEVFKEEEGMKAVLESITSQDATNLETNDHNRHENTLNVIAGEDNSRMALEEPEIIKHSVVDETEEGSGEHVTSDENNSEAAEVVPKERVPDTSNENYSEAAEVVLKEHVPDTSNESNSEAAEVVPKENVPDTSNENNSEAAEVISKEHVHELTSETENLKMAVAEEIQTTTPPETEKLSSESEEAEIAVTENIPTTSEQSAVAEHSESSEIPPPAEPSRFEDDAESSEELTTTVPQLEASTASAIIEEIKSETSAQPDEITEQYLPLENDTIDEETSTAAVPVVTDVIETSSLVPVIVTSSELPITTEITPEISTETTPVISEASFIPEQDETSNVTEDIIIIETETDSFAEEINGTVLIPAVRGETMQATVEAPAPHLEPKTSSIGWYYVIGLLAVCLVILIAVVALRNRKRGHKLRTDIGPDRDTEKSLLSNGRFKEDSEDNNVKNNEIDPLVIKQNSQINKFEKSPNFSSPKNLNVQAQDKNIEKDNVLKSTQAIIEDDDDAKKEVDDEKLEEKKKAVEELSPLIAEKVVVRTHVDLDSIPRKPIVINRNGHSYLAVPGGETKT